MRTSDCLPDPRAASTARSTFAVADTGDDELLPEDIVEFIPLREGRVAVVHDPSWQPVRGAVVGQLLYLPQTDNPISVAVKKRLFDGTEEAVMRWRSEVAAYDTSRRLHAGNTSFAEDINGELARSGHRGRVPAMVCWWVDASRGPEYGAMALSRLPGSPLRTLLEAYPEGLPLLAAVAVIRSFSMLVASTHRVGALLGDISLNNVLVEGDVSDPGSLYVNFVDLEFAGPLSSPLPEDRRAWAPQVDSAFRWRLTAEPWNGLIAYTERMTTQLEVTRRFGFETDMGCLGEIARAVFGGRADSQVRPLPADVPGPLRWLLAEILRTGDLAERIRSGRSPELATAGAFGQWVGILAPEPDETRMAYLTRLEQSWYLASAGLKQAAYRWAEASGDPAMRLWAARVALEVLPGSDDLRTRTSRLRKAADTLSSVSQDVAGDSAFAADLSAAGILDLGADPAGGLLEEIVTMLSPSADRSVLARINRLWPGLAPRAVDERPERRGGRHEFLSAEWLDQVVAHSPREAAEEVGPGSYSISIEDDRDRSFTYTIDNTGRMGTIERGTTRQARASTRVSAATLADHLDGTAYFSTPPTEGSPLWALWSLAQVAPSPNVIRSITEQSSVPRPSSGSVTPSRFGCAQWLDDLVALSAHLPTQHVPQGAWAIDVLDNPGISFTFLVSEDGRLVGWQRGVRAEPTRTSAVRRGRLIEMLNRRPIRATTDAVSVLCRVAHDIGPITESSPQRYEFLSSDWLTEFLCGSTATVGATSVSFAVVPSDSPSSSFEVGIVDGAVTTLRPLWGRPHGHDIVEVAPTGRLWDALVEGVPDDELAGHIGEPIRLLVALRPQASDSFTQASPGLGCPPGERERARRAAADRERVRRRQRQVARDRKRIADITAPFEALRAATAFEVKASLGDAKTLKSDMDSQARDLMADLYLIGDRLQHELDADLNRLIEGP